MLIHVIRVLEQLASLWYFAWTDNRNLSSQFIDCFCTAVTIDVGNTHIGICFVFNLCHIEYLWENITFYMVLRLIHHNWLKYTPMEGNDIHIAHIQYEEEPGFKDSWAWIKIPVLGIRKAKHWLISDIKLPELLAEESTCVQHVARYSIMHESHVIRYKCLDCHIAIYEHLAFYIITYGYLDS